MQNLEIRTLVVDDEEMTRQNVSKTLQRAGYQVSEAGSCQEALAKLTSETYHLVVSDLNMPNFDNVFSPRAGLDLLKRIQLEFPECFIVMLSGAGEIRHALEARDFGVTYVEKSAPSHEFLQAVADAIHINFDLDIILGRGTQLKKRQEDEEIFRRLFLDASAINVSLIASGTQGTAVYRVTPRTQDEKWRVPYAIKIGWQDHIQLEVANYRQWVEDQIGGERYAHLIGKPAYTRKRGGMVMRFLNTELDGLQNFRKFFQTSDQDSIITALNNLFDQTLAYWHQDKKLEVLLLVNAYAEYLDVDNWQLKKKMSRYLKEYAGQDIISFPDLTISFPNPIYRFLDLLNSPHDYEKRTYVSTVHGDLHAANIFVDKHLNCWLIDFTRTGQAHILRDFAELEAAIKFNVLKTDTLADLCALEHVLCSQKRLQDPIEFDHPNEELIKAATAIVTIRQKAHLTLTPGSTIAEYYLSLLFHTLTMLRFLSEAVTPSKKQSILYSASLILEQLEDFGFEF